MNFRRSLVYELVKRLQDVIFAFVVLAITTPLLLAIALWIKLDSPGPVFYLAPRVGKNNRPFRMFKFRSMVINADRIGPSSTTDCDARITRTGAFIRRGKLDEIPQFINVLTGDMSVVGPRPEIQSIVDLYTAEQRFVLEVSPGVVDFGTLWNRDEGKILEGSVDPDRDYFENIFPTKIALSQEYVRARSLALDARITLAAFLVVFFRVEPDWALPHDRLRIPRYTRDSIMGSVKRDSCLKI